MKKLLTMILVILSVCMTACGEKNNVNEEPVTTPVTGSTNTNNNTEDTSEVETPTLDAADITLTINGVQIKLGETTYSELVGTLVEEPENDWYHEQYPWVHMLKITDIEQKYNLRNTNGATIKLTFSAPERNVPVNYKDSVVVGLKFDVTEETKVYMNDTEIKPDDTAESLLVKVGQEKRVSPYITVKSNYTDIELRFTPADIISIHYADEFYDNFKDTRKTHDISNITYPEINNTPITKSTQVKLDGVLFDLPCKLSDLLSLENIYVINASDDSYCELNDVLTGSMGLKLFCRDNSIVDLQINTEKDYETGEIIVKYMRITDHIFRENDAACVEVYGGLKIGQHASAEVLDLLGTPELTIERYDNPDLPSQLHYSNMTIVFNYKEDFVSEIAVKADDYGY